MTVEHWDPETDGALSESNFRRKLERRGYRCQVYVYPSGTVFPEHSHGCSKVDGVLSGRFRIVMDGKVHDLEPGDCIAVPQGRVHRAEVLGDEEVVSIDAFKS